MGWDALQRRPLKVGCTRGYFESSILSNKALFRVYIGSLKHEIVMRTRGAVEGLYNFR